MAVICPTVTPDTVQEYDRQVTRLRPFAKRIHLDFMDGEFAPSTSPPLHQVKRPEGIHVDLHVMYQRPLNHLEEFIEFKPDLVIVHAEADSNLIDLIKALHGNGIKAGIALLQQTPTSSLKPIINELDHVLIFSGNLGYQGGSNVDFELLNKVREVHELKEGLEIGWDGGVNDQNARQLADGGIDVINVGGFIQKAENQQAAYAKLVDIISAKA